MNGKGAQLSTALSCVDEKFSKAWRKVKVNAMKNARRL
jgi:hypothetical protein